MFDYFLKMICEGVDFKVFDVKLGDDIMYQIFIQIIMEEEVSGEQMLLVSFLCQLILMYGNLM